MKKRSAVYAGRVFLLSILCAQFLILVIAGMGVKDIMLLQFFCEVLLVLPAAVFLWLQGRGLKQGIGLRGLTLKQVLLLIPTAICIDKIAELFNLLSQLFVKNEVGGYMANLVTNYPFILTFLIIAVEPAICEEITYRGVIYQGYRRGKILCAAVLSALLFGLMHMNLNQFAYAFAIGFLFVLVNEAVGSILPSILIHLYINGRSVVLMYGSITLLKMLHTKYAAAELAGDTKTMDMITEMAQGIPIQSENWLEEFMNSGQEDVVSLLPYTIVTSVIAIVALFFLIRALAKISGRMGHLRSIFRQQADTELLQGMPAEGAQQELTEPAGHRSGLYFITPCLVIGVLICIVMMAL